jgi:hypothetical protein
LIENTKEAESSFEIFVLSTVWGLISLEDKTCCRNKNPQSSWSKGQINDYSASGQQEEKLLFDTSNIR